MKLAILIVLLSISIDTTVIVNKLNTIQKELSHERN